jgi:hypothetical protein
VVDPLSHSRAGRKPYCQHKANHQMHCFVNHTVYDIVSMSHMRAFVNVLF